jgi:hypothetical protein
MGKSNKKKKFMVMARGEKIQTEGITTGKGHRTFGQKSVMWISDPAEAREIDTEYGMKGKRQVAVTTDQQYEWALNNDNQLGTKLGNIHHYTFSGFIPKEDWGGNEKVRVRTEDGYTVMSRAIAEEEGYEIIPQKRNKRREARRSSEVQNRN